MLLQRQPEQMINNIQLIDSAKTTKSRNTQLGPSSKTQTDTMLKKSSAKKQTSKQTLLHKEMQSRPQTGKQTLQLQKQNHYSMIKK
jgi:hypothetical protein